MLTVNTFGAMTSPVNSQNNNCSHGNTKTKGKIAEHGHLSFVAVQVFKEESIGLLPNDLPEHGLLQSDVLVYTSDVCAMMVSADAKCNRQLHITSDLQVHLHGHYDQMEIMLRHIELQKAANDKINLNLHVLYPGLCHFTKHVVVINSGAREWTTELNRLFGELNHLQVQKELNNDVKSCDVVRQNFQRGQGCASLNWHSDEHTKLNKPAPLDNNTPESSRRIIVMNNILKLVVSEQKDQVGECVISHGSDIVLSPGVFEDIAVASPPPPPGSPPCRITQYHK